MDWKYRIFLIMWCILIIYACYHGQDLIKVESGETNMYIYFQILSTSASVMIAILVSSILCTKFCYQNKWETTIKLPMAILSLTIIQIIMMGLVGSGIDGVCGYSDTTNFKIIISVCGGVSAIPVFYGMYRIYKYFNPSPADIKRQQEETENLLIAQKKQQKREQVEERKKSELIKKYKNEAEEEKIALEKLRTKQEDEKKRRDERHKEELEIEADKREREKAAETASRERRELERTSQAENEAARRAVEKKLFQDKLISERNQQSAQLKAASDKQESEEKARIDKNRREEEEQKQASLLQSTIYRLEQAQKNLQLAESQQKSKSTIEARQREIEAIERKIIDIQKGKVDLRKEPEEEEDDEEDEEEHEELKSYGTIANIKPKPEHKPKHKRKHEPKHEHKHEYGAVDGQLDLSPRPREHVQSNEDPTEQARKDCEDLKKKLPLMKKCDKRGAEVRQFYKKKEKTLKPHCKKDYDTIDTYETECKPKETDINDLQDIPNLEDPKMICETMHEELPQMQWCDVRGLKTRIKYNKIRSLLEPTCPGNYQDLDMYKRKCDEQKRGADEIDEIVNGPKKAPEEDNDKDCKYFKEIVDDMVKDPDCKSLVTQADSTLYNEETSRKIFGHCKKQYQRFDEYRKKCPKDKPTRGKGEPSSGFKSLMEKEADPLSCNLLDTDLGRLEKDKECKKTGPNANLRHKWDSYDHRDTFGHCKKEYERFDKHLTYCKSKNPIAEAAAGDEEIDINSDLDS